MELKRAYCDVDLHGKSDRQEWAHLRYSEHFDPKARAAFEMRLQWTVATGALIADLVGLQSDHGGLRLGYVDISSVSY